MAFSLYAATVPSYQQILAAMSGILDKAEDFCADKGIGHEEMIQARLAGDMLPFAFQVKSTAVHSIGAIDGVRKGVFSPDVNPAPTSFMGLKELVSHARTALEGVDPEELNSHEGRDMRFEFRDHRMDFVAEDFLTSFSVPNFYFHATTAYDIARMKGVPIGKRDFAGQMRLKAS